MPLSPEPMEDMRSSIRRVTTYFWVFGLVLIIFLITAWSFIGKKQYEKANVSIAAATVLLFVLLAMDCQRNSIQKALSGENVPSSTWRLAFLFTTTAVCIVTSMFIGFSNKLTGKHRRYPITYVMLQIIILGLTVGRYCYANIPNWDQRLKVSGYVLASLCVLIGIFYAVTTDSDTKGRSVFQTYLYSAGLSLFLLFIILFKWAGDGYRLQNQNRSDENLNHTRDLVHEIILAIKIACVCILLVITLLNNVPRLKHISESEKGKIAGALVGGFFLGAVTGFFLAGFNIKAIFLCGLLVGIFTMFLPVTPLFRTTGDHFIGPFVVSTLLVFLGACAFMLFFIGTYTTASSWTRWWDTYQKTLRYNWKSIFIVSIVSILFLIFLQTSGFLDATFVILPYVQKIEEECDTKKSDCMQHKFEDEGISEFIVAEYNYGKDVTNQIFISVGVMGAILLAISLLAIMGMSMGLLSIERNSRNKTEKSPIAVSYIPPPSDLKLFGLAILFSLCMNLPYYFLYNNVFKTWIQTKTATVPDKEESEQFLSEFGLVLIKFALFFYVLVALRILNVERPPLHKLVLRSSLMMGP